MLETVVLRNRDDAVCRALPQGQIRIACSVLACFSYLSGGASAEDQAKDSVVNQFSGDQLAGLARPVYVEAPGRSFTIEKVDENELPLADAEFAVLNAEGAKADTITTGADGTATSKTLPLGRYTICETAAPEGYELAPRPDAGYEGRRWRKTDLRTRGRQ